MSVVVWSLRVLLFLLLFALAIKNGFEVELRFFFDGRWQAPLSLILLIAVAIGVVLGLSALLPTLIRQRRRIQALEKQWRTERSVPSVAGK